MQQKSDKNAFFVRVLLHIVWASAWAAGAAPGYDWWVLRREMGGGLFGVPGAGVFAVRDKCAAEVRQ
ncbi:hypothetical protein, partial [Corynebacterium sp. HMSC28B08]|uniref:hypothetical protein n=1 Tax=Corynebacterium sp. HMSC28B08 TaxID=1581066 RepID=UPI001AEF90A7